MPAITVTTPAIAAEPPAGADSPDWATVLASQIFLDALCVPRREATALIAARLRLVRAEGHSEGLEQAAEAVKRAFERAAA